MKISYILQLKDFTIMLGIGFVLGIFYGLLNCSTIIKAHLVIQIIIDLIFSFISFSCLIIMINIINMGEFRLFLILGYIIGFILERITLGKIFAKGFKKLYTNIVIITKKFANSRIGRFLLK